jgi:lipoprotein signal peptidase
MRFDDQLAWRAARLVAMSLLFLAVTICMIASLVPVVNPPGVKLTDVAFSLLVVTASAIGFGIVAEPPWLLMFALGAVECEIFLIELICGHTSIAIIERAVCLLLFGGSTAAGSELGRRLFGTDRR